MTAILMVLDGIGIGPEHDSYKYGDEKCNTLENIAKTSGGINLPILESLGLGRICSLVNPQVISHSIGNVGRCFHQSPGKGTTLGHWEIVGCIRDVDFVINKGRLGDEFVSNVQKRIKRSTLHNAYSSSGIDLVNALGSLSLETGFPILYSSNDSVVQLAAHESSIDLELQYEMCNSIREMLEGDYEFGRVICRPFTGHPNAFVRTTNRKDFHNSPPRPNLLTYLKDAKRTVACVGVIGDIVSRDTYNEYFECESNEKNFKIISNLLNSKSYDLIFTNMNDFDPLLHSKKVKDVTNALIEFDIHLGTLLNELSPSDLFMLTADHGCDPLSAGTDNTRELCPLLVYGKGFESPNFIASDFPLSYVGQVIAHYLGLEQFSPTKIHRK